VDVANTMQDESLALTVHEYDEWGARARARPRAPPRRPESPATLPVVAGVVTRQAAGNVNDPAVLELVRSYSPYDNVRPQVQRAPPPRTKWTRRVPHPVLIGHAASLATPLHLPTERSV